MWAWGVNVGVNVDVNVGANVGDILINYLFIIIYY